MKLLVALLIALAPLAAHADKTFAGTSSGQWDCAKEPSVHILHGAGNYVFKGSCKRITVEGGDNRLVIEAVDALQIVGAGNIIDVGTLDTAHIIGANNTLTWRKARAGDQPRISAIGADNKIGPAR
jgi:hypothetical protein